VCRWKRAHQQFSTDYVSFREYSALSTGQVTAFPTWYLCDVVLELFFPVFARLNWSRKRYLHRKT